MTSVCIVSFMCCCLIVVLSVTLNALICAWWHGDFVSDQGAHLKSHLVIFSLCQLRMEHALLMHRFLYFNSMRELLYSLHFNSVYSASERTYNFLSVHMKVMVTLLKYTYTLCVLRVNFRIVVKEGMLQASTFGTCMQSYLPMN